MPRAGSVRSDLQQQQHVWNQEMSSSLDQEDPDPPEVKEEQEEVCISPQLVLKVEVDHQLLPDGSQAAEIQDQIGGDESDPAEVSDGPDSELQQPRVCKEEEELLTDQQLWNQEMISSLDQEDPDPPEIKEEPEEVYSRQDGETLVLKVETDAVMLIPPYEESDDSEQETAGDHQLISGGSPGAENQDQTGGEDGGSGSARGAEVHHPAPPGKKSFRCDACGKVFKFRSLLNRHQRMHTDERPFPCGTCGKAFRTGSELTDHTTIHTGEKPFFCVVCGKAFRRRGDLTIHMSIHTDEKLFPCKMCGKSFRRPGKLTAHMRVHTGEKPYPCKTCGKEFSDSSYLTRHMRMHTGEKPYSCKTCGKDFTLITTLKVHMRVHTGERPFLCKTCGKTFSAMSNLIRHMKTHTGE